GAAVAGWCSVSRMSGATPAGAERLYQLSEFTFASPASAVVGTSGSAWLRTAEVTTSALTAPERICGSRTGVASPARCTWPPGRSFTARAAPREGSGATPRPGAAGVGKGREVDAGGGLEQLDGEMREGAGAGRAVIDLAGVGAGVGDQLRQRAHAERGVDDQNLGHPDHQREQGEVLLPVERHL